MRQTIYANNSQWVNANGFGLKIQSLWKKPSPTLNGFFYWSRCVLKGLKLTLQDCQLDVCQLDDCLLDDCQLDVCLLDDCQLDVCRWDLIIIYCNSVCRTQFVLPFT